MVVTHRPCYSALCVVGLLGLFIDVGLVDLVVDVTINIFLIICDLFIYAYMVKYCYLSIRKHECRFIGRTYIKHSIKNYLQ